MKRGLTFRGRQAGRKHCTGCYYIPWLVIVCEAPTSTVDCLLGDTEGQIRLVEGVASRQDVGRVGLGQQGVYLVQEAVDTVRILFTDRDKDVGDARRNSDRILGVEVLDA